MGDETDICIAGGGPAGMVAGLLFARAGLRTTVLEKHGDFLRDFRGDTVHPSTLRIFDELGLLERLLARPHDKVHGVSGLVGGRRVEIADFSRFDPRWNFIAMMPQWEFLDFVAEAAAEYPGFRLERNAEATGLVVEQGRVAGVALAGREIRARLVIAANGRGSVLRAAAGFQVRDLGAPIDVFWFRVPKAQTAENDTTGVFAAGRIMALIDRGEYWQCAYVFPKGSAEAVEARGIAAFREEVSALAPRLGDLAAVRSWEDVKLLSVSLDRLEHWSRPGLLAIGDAAHAMSPIGGVGINLAVQDAVAAANVLAGPMARGEDPDPLLASVEERRLPAVRLIQAFQKAAQDRIITPLLMRQKGGFKPPLALRLLNGLPVLRRLPAALIGFGYRAEHVRSPVAAPVKAGRVVRSGEAAPGRSEGRKSQPFWTGYLGWEHYTGLWATQDHDFGADPIAFYSYSNPDPAKNNYYPAGDVIAIYASMYSPFPHATTTMLLTPGDDPDSLRHPVDFQWLLDDHGSGNTNNIHYWWPVAPPGYIALGVCFSRGEKPRLQGYWCVKECYAVACPTLPAWNDKGQRWRSHNGSLWAPYLESPGADQFVPNVYLSEEASGPAPTSYWLRAFV